MLKTDSRDRSEHPRDVVNEALYIETQNFQQKTTNCYCSYWLINRHFGLSNKKKLYQFEVTDQLLLYKVVDINE